MGTELQLKSLTRSRNLDISTNDIKIGPWKIKKKANLWTGWDWIRIGSSVDSKKETLLTRRISRY